MKDRNGQDNQGGTEMRERVYIPRKKETKIVSELFSETRLFHASRNYVACHWQHHIKITPKYLHSITIDIFWSMDSHLPLIFLFTIKTLHFFFIIIIIIILYKMSWQRGGKPLQVNDVSFIFWLLTLSKAACTIDSLSLSSADVASSNNKILGSFTRARAMAIRCFCPPLSWVPRSPTRVS